MDIEINETTPLWWELQNIPTQLIRELRRRKANNNIGINYLNPNDADESFKDNFDPAYKGPLTPWVRVFSNSTGIPRSGPQTVIPTSEYLGKTPKDGFLLRGGEGFFDAFGYKQGSSLSDSKAIIGYQANGQPHYLSGDRDQYRYSVYPGDINDNRISQNNITPSLLPPPGVISLNIKQARDFLTFGSFKFNCYGLAQLEYLTPYFLSPGINLSIEFGYNYYNRQSLLDLNDVSESYELARTPQKAIDKALLSNGNYGCITGIITKFNFSTTDGFLYECNAEITSRQGLFAGMKIDDVVTVKENNQTKAYLNLKQCILNELSDQSLREMYNEQNFYDYLIETRGNSSNNSTVDNSLPQSTVSFYDGKPEDRIFTGRDKDIYGENTSPIRLVIGKTRGRSRTTRGQSTINYGESFGNKQSYSFLDDTDFDKNSDKTWVQLDFVFELCNLFMSNNDSLENKIDISQIIINAHPNLISFDKDVLIPNPISPKINRGTQSPGGYLINPFDEINKFSTQRGNIQDSEHKRANDKIKEVFKVDPPNSFSIYRDNLDRIINYLYYKSDNGNTSAAFPFEEVTRDLEDKYTKYYHGYLKHIYISVEKLKNIAKDNSNNYLEFLNSIINTINGAVDNVWDLEVVRNENGGISIIDKNLKTKKEKIYMFEVGGTNTCIREVNFDVSLTNEQSTNIYYSNDSNTERSLADRSPNNQYSDRLDEFFIDKKTTPGITAETNDSNKAISQLQTHGNQFVISQEVLQMTTRLLTDEEYENWKNIDTNTNEIDSEKVKSLFEKEGFVNYTYLNLPSSMKGYLRKILTDNDEENNAIKYSGVSDNFQVTIVFDGIFALRNLQVFALSNLPKPYVPGNVIFQVLEVDHNIQNGSWKTNVTALLRTVGNNDTEYILV